MAGSYENLTAWKKGMEVVEGVYAATRRFPRDEQFGLTNQLRRAAVSVPSNIAEGKGRLTDKEYSHFLGNARGSLLELATQLRIARNLGYLDELPFAQLHAQADEVGRLLNGLLTFLRHTQPPRPNP